MDPIPPYHSPSSSSSSSSSPSPSSSFPIILPPQTIPALQKIEKKNNNLTRAVHVLTHTAHRERMHDGHAFRFPNKTTPRNPAKASRTACLMKKKMILAMDPSICLITYTWRIHYIHTGNAKVRKRQGRGICTTIDRVHHFGIPYWDGKRSDAANRVS